MKIQSKLILITGAASGIGRATAVALAKNGGRLILLDKDEPGLSQVVEAICTAGGEAQGYSLDLTDADRVKTVAQEILETNGVPDVLINNAGAGRFLFLEETSPEEAVRMMASPYFGAVYLTQAFLPGMLKRGSGRIANVTSPAAYVPWPGATAYTAARWAMRGLTEALRADLRGTGIGVMLVCPVEVSSGYWDHNPGSRPRVPGITRLYSTLSPERVAQGIVSGLKKDRSEVFLPFLFHLTLKLYPFFPGVLHWLVWKTGWKRLE
jgi:short-subunit dehydrogenase